MDRLRSTLELTVKQDTRTGAAETRFLPGTQLSGAHTALLALILWAYLMISSEEMLPAENTTHQTRNQSQQPQHASESVTRAWWLTFPGFVNGFEFLFGLVNSSGLKRRRRRRRRSRFRSTVMNSEHLKGNNVSTVYLEHEDVRPTLAQSAS